MHDLSSSAATHFDPRCRDCPRLARFLDEVRALHPEYHCAPVAPFGDVRARLLIVGLAPGLHGANRTGRPFTGDFAGVLLYRTLHRFGFASQATSSCADDPLRLIDCRITNAVKCVPPQNKPQNDEVRACNRYLAAELHDLAPGSAVLALGTIAHRAVLRAVGLKSSGFAFAHGQVHNLGHGRTLFDSYHCSRYNTQTRRLTASMFEAVFESIALHLRQR